MTTYNVTNPTEFYTAIDKSVGGDKIVLASGDYGSPWIQNKSPSSYVSIQAAAGASVHFDGLTVITSKNLSFSGIDIGRPLGPTDPEYTRLTDLRDSSNLKFDGMKFHGSLDGDPSNDGIGLYGLNITGLSVTNSEFTDLYRGTTVQTSSNVTLANNNLHLIRSDGMISFGTDNVVIDGNRFSDFHPVLGDHADMIQFFNVGLTKGASNITVKNNVLLQTYYSGIESTGVQGIWITDGGDLGYKNVLVQNNLLYSNDLYNGITVNQTVGAQILGNTVVSTPADDKSFWIRLEGDVGVNLQNNVTDNILSTDVSQFFQSGNVNFALDPAQRANIANLLHPTSVSDLIFPGVGYQVPTASSTAPVSNALGSGIGSLISPAHSASVGATAVADTSLTSAATAKSALVSVTPTTIEPSVTHSIPGPLMHHFDYYVAIA